MLRVPETDSEGPMTEINYDEIPYPSSTIPLSHPDRLALIGRLFHFNAPDPEHCRVLELGCSHGYNLIPMAVELPNSTFFGIDLSKVQIEEGKTIIASLGLGNIQLEQWDILDLDPSADNRSRYEIGTFDYIIAHGIYSWVPAHVRAAVLRVSKGLLSPNGIAYISYNANPGWKMRSMVRDMMLYHTRNAPTALARISAAREFVSFLGRETDSGRAYGKFFREEFAKMQSWPDAYLAHESFSEHNQPYYFEEFISDAEAHGLQYLGDSNLSTMFPSNYPPEVQQAFGALSGGIVSIEQYMDFITGRMFRQSLLVHRVGDTIGTSSPTINRSLRFQDIGQFFFTSGLLPQHPSGNLLSDDSAEFEMSPVASEGRLDTGPRRLTTRLPIMKAALTHMSEVWPNATSFDELFEQSVARLSTELKSQDTPVAEFTPSQLTTYREQLLESLFHCMTKDLVEVRVNKSAFTTEIGERPEASPLARLEALSGSLVTTLRHTKIFVGILQRIVLVMLDGMTDRAAIVAELIRRLDVDKSSGQRLELMKDGTPLREHPDRVQLITAEVELLLHQFARVALLVKPSMAA